MARTKQTARKSTGGFGRKARPARDIEDLETTGAPDTREFESLDLAERKDEDENDAELEEEQEDDEEKMEYGSDSKEAEAGAQATEQKEQQPENPIDPSLLDAYTNAKAMGDTDMIEALEAALTDSYGADWKVLAGLEKAAPAPKHVVRDQRSRIFDFRTGTLPEGTSLVGAQGVFEAQRDGSTCLVVPPVSHLLLDDLRLTPVNGQKVNEFTITMDILLEHLPSESLALFQTCSDEGRITEGEAFLYRNGGVGVFGEVGVENAIIRPNKWARVVITLGASPFNPSERVMTTYVNGVKCASISSFKRGVIGTNDGRFSLNPDRILLFASSQEENMPGCRIKYCEIECRHKTEEEVKQDSYKNRIFSTYDAERMAELEKLYTHLTLQPLYKRPPPVWMHPCVLAEFGDAFLENTGLEGGNHATTAAVYYMAMQRMLGECGPMYLDGFDHSSKQAINALCQCMQDFKELARKFALVENSSQLVGFIKRFKRRLENLKEGEYVLVPSTINAQMLLFIVEYEADDQFRFSVVNTSPTRGLDWHLATAETAPKIKYKTVLSVCNVRRAKIMDDAFWSMLFKLSVYGTAKRGAFDELYDWLLPFLVDKPLEAILGDMQDDPAIAYRSPERSNTGYMRGLIEASTYLLRRQGLTVDETKMFAFAMRAQMLEFVRHDLQFVNKLTDSDKKVLRMICEQVAYAAVKLAKKGLLTASQLDIVHTNVEEVNRQSTNKRLHTISSSHIRRKIDLEDGRASRLEDIQHPFFDRLLRTEDVDGLAGAPIVNPKYVPIDALLIPKCVENFEEALAALRYCDKLCTLMSVQQHCVKNRHHLKVSLIEHTFTKIVPVPKSPIADDYDACVWRTPLRYAVQLDVMILLQRILEHFVAAVFALHSTKALDALKLVIPACIAAIADVVMRKEATDIPSELCMHLQGAPGRQGFGLSIGHFDSQSETIEVHYPELHIARTAVLDYFSTQRNLTKIFCWENGNQPEDTLAEFFASLCAEVAFPQNPIAYLAQTNALVMKNYPEFHCYRDIAFYFKFFQNTDLRKFPPKADYEQIHAELSFQFQMGQFIIQGMGMHLQCYPEPPLTFTHRYPSMTSPSHLTDPHIVRTEDDVLHIKNLPSFEDAIGQQDSELLISYLTVPYIRVPLVLTFFSTEDRIHSLKSTELQAVLDGVLFEPGRYLAHDMNTEPREVPARDQRLLATSYGHLVNELHRSPEVVVNSVVRLIQLALDLDTGTVHSTTVPIILYVIRMAARVQNYIKFLIDYATNQHESIRIALRDVVVLPEVLGTLQQGDAKIAEFFCGPVHRMLEAWNAEAMKECENVTDDQVLDENSRLACNLHAHLLMLYRSFREDELTLDVVQTILAAQIFLTTRHTWNLDLLPVPENEMFEILCVLRRRVISWLRRRSQQELNAVMEAVVRVAAGTGVRKQSDTANQDFNRLWAFVRGDRSIGRFTVATVRRQGTADGSERAVQEVDPNLEFGIEIDVQIMQLTLKSSHLQALDTQIAGNVDVQTIFGSKSMQASEVQSTEHRQWVHLIGRNHDIQYWRTPDPRPCYQELDRDYVPGELEDTEGWIVPLLEPVRMAYLVKPFVLQICLPERPLPADADVAYLVGIHPKLGGTWKEIFVFKTLRMVQIYNVYSHGRRFYRTLEYSTDARFTLRDMQPSIEDRMSPWPEWGRYEVGHPYAAYRDPTSCVITRSWDCTENLSGGVETFIPQRLLWGVVPHALLETHLFWQDEADNLRGYPIDKKNPYVITVQLQNVNKIEATQLPGTNAVIKRTLRTTHEERMKVLSAMFVHVDECGMITGEWAPNFAFFQGLESFRAAGFDAAAFGAAISELKALGRTFESSDDLMQAVREFPAPMQAEPSSATARYKTLDEEELILVDLLYARKESKLFSLAQTLTRIEMLSYVLAWTKDATYDPMSGREPLSLDFVELPRVKLSFHGRKDEHGVTRLYSMDHSHLFVSNYESKLTEQLMAGIPHSLLMATSNNELQILVPAINPFRPRIGSAPFSTELVLARDDPEWYAKLDTNYFLYPVHVSLSFLFSPTLSSALYLLLLRLLHRDYEAVFRLANSIGTDTELSPEESMIFDALARCNGDANPDAHACRLKINLVIIDSPVTAPWDLTIQMSRYITKLSHVSAVCRLTHDEELQLLSRCICDVSDPRFDPRFYTVYEITLVKNRKHYLLAAKQGLQEAPVFLVPPLRGTAWILERNQTALEANESAWNTLTVQYAAPMQMTGTALLDETHKVWRGEDMLGQYANFGFLFLYELLTGTKKAKMLKDDCSISLALLLFQKYVDKSSFMGSILSMLMFNPHLCTDAPRFKDSRQFKNTAINGFPDDNEPVSPLADLFTRVLPYLMEHIDEFKEPADPSLFIPIVPAPETCPVIPEGPRDWVLPTISDFGCSERPLNVVTPQDLPALALSHDELAFLCSSPLDVISIGSYVAMIKRSDLALPAVDHRLPFDVTDHSQAKSAVAVSMIERLQNDMVYFADETNKGDIPKMICLLDDVVRNNLVQVVDGTVQATEALQAAIATLTELVQKLEALREQDAAYVDRSLPWMEEFANAVELHNEQKQPDMERLIFALRRFSKQEVTLWTEFMFGSVLSSAQVLDMQRLNPYLGEDKINLLTSVMVGCIFHANRVGHINRCVSDARDVLKLLQKVGQPGTTVVDGGNARLTAEHEASIVLKGESLARQLTMNRYFVSSAEQKQAVATTAATPDHIDITAVAAAARAQQTLLYDPRFLLFEFTWNILLRESQVILIREFMDALANGRSLVKQMIMGAGKTTVVGPLLTLILGDGKSLVMQVVPPALLEFSRSVMRSTFSSIMHKRIYTLNFDRASEPDPNMYRKLQNAIRTMGVVISTPTAVKSVMLKYIELLDMIRDPTRPRHPDMERDAFELNRVLQLFNEGVLIMDEVDLILHPMKSELNFPIGAKFDLDFSPQRWQLPIHILDAIFYAERRRMSVNFKQSTRAKVILEKLDAVIQEGYRTRALQRNPHIVLLNPDWYHEVMKPIIADWTYLWLEAQHMANIRESEIKQYILEGAHQLKNPELAIRVNEQLSDTHKKMINLAHDWLRSYLPHVLQKIDRVSFGIMNKEDYERAVKADPNMPRTRAKLAIPFVGKDVPSRSSEFAHPDVIIGLSILAYRYEGLRWTDFEDIVSNLRATLTKEMGPWNKRKSSLRYARWVKEAGGRIKGQAKYQDETGEQRALLGEAPMDLADVIAGEEEPGQEETYDDAMEVVPLRLLKRSNQDQMEKLFDIIRLLPDTIHWYLENFIFPSYMRHQVMKLSACGQEVGGDMLFTRRIGFSGTPSDLLPVELGRCGYEKGSDGQMIHVMTSPDIVSFEIVPEGWSVKSLLDRIAQAQSPQFNALIDTGALITGMTNYQVAKYLLDHGLSWCEGVVFLDEYDRKMILVRATGRVVKMAQSGIPANKRFAFYDQVHTTGMDIQHMLNAKAVLTLGKDMTFRDYAQGAFRMRGIAKGQTIHLFIIPEVYQLMQRELSGSKTSGNGVALLQAAMPVDASSTSSPSTAQDAVAAAPPGHFVSFHLPSDGVRRVLVDVVAWLVVNSMRSERVQFNQLCLQNIGNVWRKPAFKTVLHGLQEFKVSVDPSSIPPHSMQSLDVFCESIDFSLEAGVPEPVLFAESIRRRVEAHIQFITFDEQRKIIDDIVQTVSGSFLDETDRVLSAEMVQEQEEEKEKQQEQEQEQEIEIEKYVDLAYSRENEEPVPWEFATLAMAQPSQFYKLEEFKLYKRRPLHFPDFVSVSNNYFDKRWSGARRVKNVVMVLDWTWDTSALGAQSHSLEPLTEDQERTLATAIELFDQNNSGQFDLHALELVLKAAAHLKFDNDQLQAFVNETVGTPSPVLSYEQIRSVLVSGRFDQYQSGRRFVALSLAEAETIRRIMHMRLGSPIIDGTNTTMALRCLPAGFVVTDRTTSFAEAPNEYMTKATQQSLRFFNCEMFLSEENLNVLLRALHNTTRRERLNFFRNIIGCRRRMARKWEETPLAKVFALADQFGMLKQRAQSVRVREGIKELGLLLYDAFNKFDYDKNGLLSPAEVWGAFDFLGMHSMTAHDVIDFVRTADTDRDGNISYKEFIEILQDPEAVEKGEGAELDDDEEVAMFTPAMQRQVSLSPVEPRGQEELEAVQAQIILDEQREDELAQQREQEEEARIQAELEIEEDERDRVQEGGRNPKISGDMIRYDFSTGRRPRRISTRGDIAYRPDESANKQFLKVFAPCVLFLEVPFGGNCGGMKLNQYTVTMEVMFEEFPQPGEQAALFSTAKYNESNALVYVASNGTVGRGLYFGDPETSSSMEPNRWHYITLVSDCIEGTLTTYIDGQRCSEVPMVEGNADEYQATAFDGPFSCGDTVCLFAAKNAGSCKGGNLRQVVVTSHCLQGGEIFEVIQNLKQEMEGDVLTHIVTSLIGMGVDEEVAAWAAQNSTGNTLEERVTNALNAVYSGQF